METQELSAGREMDGRIHAEVFGVPILGTVLCEPWHDDPTWHPSYDQRSGELRPVFLDDCTCDLPDLGTESEAPIILEHHPSCLGVVPFYSTDIAAAFMVIDALNGPHCRHWLAEMLQATDQTGEYGGSVVWTVELRHIPTGKHVFGIAPSLPEAICKAALKAAEWV